jgi:predicted nucleotidyltransferase
MTQTAVFEALTNFVAEKLPDAEVFLFGSRASETSNSDSDWDVLVLLDQEEVSKETEKSIMDDFYELELKTGNVIAPLIYSKVLWNTTRPITRLYQKISEQGIRIK